MPAPNYGKSSSRTKLDKTFSSIIEYLKEGLSPYIVMIDGGLNHVSCVVIGDHDPSICHYINISGSICQGYLVKEGG